MADEADAANIQEMLTLDAAIAAARHLEPHAERGTCLFCGEPCAADAILHPDCREDYEREQRAMKIRGRAG